MPFQVLILRLQPALGLRKLFLHLGLPRLDLFHHRIIALNLGTGRSPVI